MDAKIAVSMTPAEFDLVRTVLDEEYKHCLELAKDKHTDFKLTSAARQRAILLDDILSRLR